MKQTLLGPQEGYRELDQYWRDHGVTRLFLVCGRSIQKIPIWAYFDGLERRLGIPVIRFSDFRPNPDYESVLRGIRAFQASGCDMIVAVGGGSAMDVGKCIRLWSCANPDQELLEQQTVSSRIGLLVVPTTAGSGSEATQFAVIYRQGRKQSISNADCLPMAVLFDPGVLNTLPDYHKKAAMLDALCHGIESYWSVNSTEESQAYSHQAIQMLLANWEGYLRGEGRSGEVVQRAAYLAGKAINITRTTAGHAMCYQLTSCYGAVHGSAAALCVGTLWPYMLAHTQDCVDPRGAAYLCGIFRKIAAAMGCGTPEQAAERFQALLGELEVEPLTVEQVDFDRLAALVAPERLCNHPIVMNSDVIKGLYREILHTA